MAFLLSAASGEANSKRCLNAARLLVLERNKPEESDSRRYETGVGQLLGQL